MRISDWSSDVCSSDLPREQPDSRWGNVAECGYILGLKISGDSLKFGQPIHFAFQIPDSHALPRAQHVADTEQQYRIRTRNYLQPFVRRLPRPARKRFRQEKRCKLRLDHGARPTN